LPLHGRHLAGFVIRGVLPRRIGCPHHGARADGRFFHDYGGVRGGVHRKHVLRHAVRDGVLLRWRVHRPLAARGVKRLRLRLLGGLRPSVRRVLRHERVLLLVTWSQHAFSCAGFASELVLWSTTVCQAAAETLANKPPQPIS
ncbi:unnamed protein product, partial [Ectocarpus fasciculatus]